MSHKVTSYKLQVRRVGWVGLGKVCNNYLDRNLSVVKVTSLTNESDIIAFTAWRSNDRKIVKNGQTKKRLCLIFVVEIPLSH